MKATGNRLAICSMAALTLCLLFTACQDDGVVDNGNNRKDICFGVVDHSVSGDSATASSARSAAKTTPTQRFVLRNEGATDSLFMSATVTDGITPSDSTSTSVASTRGIPITSADNMENFQVLAYWQQDGNLNKSSFYMNETMTKLGSGWSSATGNTYYWPGSDHSLRFVAISPAPTAEILELSASPENTTLTYNVPSAASDQPDIMIGKTTDDTYIPGNGTIDGVVSLAFSHICTAIKFKLAAGMDPAKVTAIRLKGIGTSAAYSFDSGEWSAATATGDVKTPATEQGKLDFVAVKGDDGVETGEHITSDEHTFIVLPQLSLPSTATIEIDYDGKAFTAKVGGQKWPQGKTLVYGVSVNSVPGGIVDFDITSTDSEGKTYKVYFATKNLGANNESDYGNYYAWGETDPKSNYSWSTYEYGNDYDELTKYCSDSSYGNNGFTDNLETLVPADDAATQTLGENWRMPTQTEWQALVDKCNKKWLDGSNSSLYNGVKGWLFWTGSSTDAPADTDPQIFLPAAGSGWDTSLGTSAGSNGHYWSSSLNTSITCEAYFLYFKESSEMDPERCTNRFFGFSVRPVFVVPQ